MYILALSLIFVIFSWKINLNDWMIDWYIHYTYLFIYLCIYLFIYLSIYLSIYLTIFVTICLSILHFILKRINKQFLQTVKRQNSQSDFPNTFEGLWFYEGLTVPPSLSSILCTMYSVHPWWQSTSVARWRNSPPNNSKLAEFSHHLVVKNVAVPLYISVKNAF